MVHKVLLWSGFGVAVRLWQLGIEMRPLFTANQIPVYGVFGAMGGAIGYWLMGVEQRQIAWLAERKQSLIDKRKRRADRDGIELDDEGLRIQKKGVVESIRETLTGSAANDTLRSGVELKPEEGRGPNQLGASKPLN